MFDVIQIVFWSITYIAIAVNSWKNYSRKLVAIPQCAVLMNFAWEINALIESEGFWGHILWLGLDCLIFIHALTTMPSKREKLLFVFGLLVGTILLYVIFNYLSLGMLMSVFVIDLIMAILFMMERKQLLVNGRVFIALTKFIGDTAAAIYYSPYSMAVMMIGIVVFFINLVYLICSICEKQTEKVQTI